MIDEIIEQIKAWDCDDIHELRLLFRKLSMAIASERMRTPEISRLFADHLDISALPSIRFFEEIDMTKYVGFPVWAMDRCGYCLTGKEMDHVTHIVEVAEVHGEMERQSKGHPSRFGSKINIRGRRKDILG